MKPPVMPLADQIIGAVQRLQAVLDRNKIGPIEAFVLSKDAQQQIIDIIRREHFADIVDMKTRSLEPTLLDIKLQEPPFRMPLCDSGRVVLKPQRYEFYIEDGCGACKRQADRSTQAS